MEAYSVCVCVGVCMYGVCVCVGGGIAMLYALITLNAPIMRMDGVSYDRKGVSRRSQTGGGGSESLVLAPWSKVEE